MLHRVYHFDLIEFPDGWPSVFGPSRCGEPPGAWVPLDCASNCMRPAHGSVMVIMAGPRGLASSRLIIVRRYAFENADVQMAPSHYMRDYVERQGWKVREPVVAYPFPDPIVPAPRPTITPRRRLCSSALEIRKGLELFLDAVSDLPASVDVTFLGRDTVLPSGQLATEYIQHRLRSRSFTIHTEFMREQALKYLAAENRLSVIASLSERFGFTVAECAVNGLPFIAARAGGISEIIPEPEIQGLFFEPTSRDLRRCLTEYFKMCSSPPSPAPSAAEIVSPTIRNAS